MKLRIPRAALLALWLADVRDHGLAHLYLARAAIEDGIEEHQGADGEDFDLFLSDLCAGLEVAYAVFPQPGALLLPAQLAEEAASAGEAVVVRTPGRPDARVAFPHAETFGPHGDEGAVVTWHVHHVDKAPPLPATPSQARADLTHALSTATDTLTRMDVAKWRPDEAEEIAFLAGEDLPASIAERLPPGMSSRQLSLLVRSLRLLAITDLAGQDDGAAANLWQIDQRSTALRHIGERALTGLSSATLTAPSRSAG